MSKQQFVKRIFLIISKLRKKGSSFDEIKSYLQLYSELDEENYEISLRTFQRDLQEIAKNYNIEISYNRSQNIYEIISEGNETKNERLMEAFEIYNALNLKDNLSNHIILEKRKPLGTENIYGLLHAIKNNFIINFSEEKFWEDEKTKLLQSSKPLALKEAKNRWYLIGINPDNQIQRFCLDRISDLEITNIKFENKETVNLEEIFYYSFGIITETEKPKKIVLSFSYEQGKYIKSLPLHHSQKEIINSIDEYRIELLMNTTYDFVMELLSFGEEVKVIEPKSLQTEIRLKLLANLKLYE